MPLKPPFPSQALLDGATCALDAPHLLHMPSHIFCLLGRYGDAIRANELAGVANDALYAGRGGTDFYRGDAQGRARVLPLSPSRPRREMITEGIPTRTELR